MIVFKVTLVMFLFCKNVRTLKGVFFLHIALNILLQWSRGGLLLAVLLQSVASAWLPLASTSSTFSFLLPNDFDGLDNGVPIKIILDVIGWHAMHLEVSRRYHVLVVHLCMMSWRGNRGR